MIEIPADPVQQLIESATHLGKRIALSLMNDYEKISLGNMSNLPNDIMALGIGYEKLESEVPTNSLRYVARQLNALKEDIHMQLIRRLSPRKLKILAERMAEPRLKRMS